MSDINIKIYTARTMHCETGRIITTVNAFSLGSLLSCVGRTFLVQYRKWVDKAQSRENLPFPAISYLMRSVLGSLSPSGNAPVIAKSVSRPFGRFARDPRDLFSVGFQRPADRPCSCVLSSF